jgi:hypothetical protein
MFKINPVDSIPCLLTLVKSICFIVDPGRNFSDDFIPSIILFLSAPRFTREHNIISPDMPATYGSMIITIDKKSPKIHIKPV